MNQEGTDDEQLVTIHLFSGTPEEQQELATLANDWSEDQGFWASDSILESMKQPDTLFWYAKSTLTTHWIGACIGRISGDDAELLYIHTLKPTRGHGVAGLLLDEMRTSLGERGLSGKLFLEVRKSNEIAQKLYRSQGFRQTGVRPRYYKDGEDALIFETAIY